MNSKARTNLAVVVVAVCSALVILIANSKYVDLISVQLEDGVGESHRLETDYSHLSVVLESMNSGMDIRVMVDGLTIYERVAVLTVDFGYSMGLGHHTVTVMIENPAGGGSLFGPPIFVSGKISCGFL